MYKSSLCDIVANITSIERGIFSPREKLPALGTTAECCSLQLGASGVGKLCFGRDSVRPSVQTVSSLGSLSVNRR